MGESSAQVRWYIRLIELQPELQQMVDGKKIGLTPAVELSYLKPEARNISLPIEKLRRYFPRSYTPRRMEETIFKLLEGWAKRRQQNQKR